MMAGEPAARDGALVEETLLWDAVARWQALVRLRREQFERLRSETPDPEDYWRRRSANYYGAVRARREPDAFVRAVMDACRDAEAHDARWATGAEPPPATVLDVGGGFGAVAVPLAASGRRVTAVEPHPSMVHLLGEWAADERVSHRIRVVQEPWPLAASQVGPHDVVVCSHVLYPIEDVVPFLDALVAASRRACLVTLRLGAAELAPPDLFERLHGERRVPQPGFGDLCAVLADRRIPFTARTYESDSTWSFADLDEAEEIVSEALLAAGRPDARAVIREWAAGALEMRDGRLVAEGRRTLAGIAAIGPGGAQPTRS